MVIGRNYFVITDRLYKTIFNDNLFDYKHTQTNFTRGVVSNITYLNYYSFNILLSATKNQNTIFHTLTNDFFNDLSIHKKKLIFCGEISDDYTLFIPTKIIYLHPHKKLGIYVRKKIITKFSAFDVTIIMDKKQHDVNISVFTLQ